MQQFATDFALFTSQFFNSVRSFLTSFVSGSILGEIFLFCLIFGIFFYILSQFISLGGGD